MDSLVPAAFLLSLSVYITVFTFRRLVESIWPSLSRQPPITRANRIWEEFVLPVLPAYIGALFCLVVSPLLFQYPEVAATSRVSRALYGLCVGWFSAWSYRIVKALIQAKWNVPFPDATWRK